MGIKVDTKGLEEDILKYMKTFSKAYAKEGSKQITKKAQSCIEMFYRDYTPKYYDRTYDLKNNSYVPYYHDNGKAYYGGVRITADFEGHPSLIPASEISELRGMVDLKQRDIMTNQYEIHSYISNQIERITEVGSVVLKPILDKLATELENMDEKDIEKFTKALERGLKRVK